MDTTLTEEKVEPIVGQQTIDGKEVTDAKIDAVRDRLKDDAERKAADAAALADEDATPVRRYVVLEKFDLEGEDDAFRIVDAAAQGRPQGILERIAEELGYATTLVCIPASKFVERPVAVDTVVKVTVG